MTWKDFLKKYMTKNLCDARQIEKKVSTFWSTLLSRDPVIIDWASSPYAGVHEIYFRDRDLELYFELFGIDLNEFKSDFDSIKDPDINHTYEVSTNPFTVFNVILMHCVTISKDILDSKKDYILTQLYVIVGYRFTTSAYSRYFRPPVKLDVAKRVLDSMSMKYDLKSEGSNYGILLAKSKMIHTHSKMNPRLKRFKAKDMVDIANGLSGSIRGSIKTAKALTVKVIEEGKATETISLHLDTDDSSTLRIVQNGIREYYDIGHSIILSRDELINSDLIELTAKVIPGIDENLLEEALTFLSSKALEEPKRYMTIIDNIIDGTIEYLFNSNHYPPYDESLDALLSYLKSYWSNSKQKDKRILNVKNEMVDILTKDMSMRRTLITRYSIIVPIYIMVRIVLDKKISVNGA